MLKYNRYTFWVLLFTTIVFTCTVFNISKWRRNLVINNDAVSYYSYLPAAFIYKDLHFKFTDSLPDDFEGRIWFQTTQDGFRVQKMTMGMAVLYSPFFFIAHAIAGISDYKANGYSEIYSMLICFAGLFYGLLGLIILSKILLHFFSDKIVAITILSIAFGTNFFFYVTNEGEMSHSFSFFLFSLFLYYSLRWNEQQTLTNTLLIGLTGGLIVLVRPSNIIAFLIPFLIGVSNFETLKSKFFLLFKHWWQIIIIVLLVFLIFSPQLFYWKSITGNWVFYSYGDEGFFFNKPQLINGLFSFRKGWLIYTPLMILSLIGIPMLYAKLRNFSIAITLFVVINIYIVFSWWSWWYGGGFGARSLIESYVFLSIPLAVFYNYIFKKKVLIRVVAGILLFLLISLNLFQTLQYRRTIIHWDSMTKEAYWTVFGKLKFPKNYKELIQTPDYENALKGMEERSE